MVLLASLYISNPTEMQFHQFLSGMQLPNIVPPYEYRPFFIYLTKLIHTFTNKIYKSLLLKHILSLVSQI